MSPRDDKLTIHLDGRACEVPAGATILEAARQYGVYIPTLCTHGDLLPFGACRMCIVEVGGLKGFPTACTTPVQNGMAVRTDSDKVKELRLEVLRLMLSHHPCGCLACEENEDCRSHSGTTRKAGVTTGCRTCPNDGACELQDVVDHVGLKDIDLPVYYRELHVEKDDPFYDRDYNLCILCGRCVRICQDVRAAGTLAFQRRGGRTVIGPAYGRTHLDSGCEFCGACVSACPTGALSEKVRKWDGRPDREEITTCPLCGLGCQVRVLVKEGRVIGTLPAGGLDAGCVDNRAADRLAGAAGDPSRESATSSGELCVKGRFCQPEIVNDYRRLKKPYVIRDNVKLEIGWEEAISIAAQKLSSCPPERFAILVSPNCTNEEIYIAQKFARVAMRSNNVDTSARLFYGAAFREYLNLLKLSAPVSDIAGASAILAVGLDTRFGRSRVGVELRKAVRRGAKLVTIHPRHHNLSFMADEWLRPDPGAESETVGSLADAVAANVQEAAGSRESGGAKEGQPERTNHSTSSADEFSAAARLLLDAKAPLILVGPEVIHDAHGARILEIIEKLARALGARVLALPAQNNLFGSILMGAYPELLPGGFASSDKGRIDAVEKAWAVRLPDLGRSWTARFLARSASIGPSANGKTDSDGLDVLYLVGEVPADERPSAAFVIYQNISPSNRSGYADLVLPAAAFTEVDGTFLNSEGRIRRLRKAVDPPGEALPDWEILCRIARKMGIDGFGFGDVREIHREIGRLVRGFGNFDALDDEPLPFVCEGEMAVPEAEDVAGVAVDASARSPAGTPSRGRATNADEAYPYVLTASIEEHTYKGFPISTWVGGAREIFPDGLLDISPGDAENARISDGDEVVVWSFAFKRTWRARIAADQTEGSLHVTLRQQERLDSSPQRVNLRRRDV